jgi:hypothetical protein
VYRAAPQTSLAERFELGTAVIADIEGLVQGIAGTLVQKDPPVILVHGKNDGNWRSSRLYYVALDPQRTRAIRKEAALVHVPDRSLVARGAEKLEAELYQKYVTLISKVTPDHEAIDGVVSHLRHLKRQLEGEIHNARWIRVPGKIAQLKRRIEVIDEMIRGIREESPVLPRDFALNHPVLRPLWGRFSPRWRTIGDETLIQNASSLDIIIGKDGVCRVWIPRVTDFWKKLEAFERSGGKAHPLLKRPPPDRSGFFSEELRLKFKSDEEALPVLLSIYEIIDQEV